MNFTPKVCSVCSKWIQEVKKQKSEKGPLRPLIALYVPDVGCVQWYALPIVLP